ncbi:hypothetical protein JCM3765_003785 [Sporobolomyces pararoseus]
MQGQVSTRIKAHIATGYDVDSIWKGIRPEPSRLDKLLPEASGHRRLVTPSELRKATLSKLITSLPRINISQPQQAGYLVHVASLVKWITIVEYLKSTAIDRDDSESILAQLELLLAKSERVLLEEIFKPLEPLPAYSASQSLRHRGRIGLRQLALRPDLETFGFARDGGLLF